MNYEDLSLKIPYIQTASGHTLTLEERAALQNSLSILKNNNKIYHLQFWGKIYGVQRDYLIAHGFSNKDLLGDKKLFCSYNAVDWVQLTLLNEETKELCRKLGTLSSRFKLVGDLAHEYIVEVLVSETKQVSAPHKQAPNEDDDENEDDDDDAEIEITQQRGPVKSRAVVTEESWLVYLINSIDQDTAIVPRGSVTLNSTRHTVVNEAFSGLTPSQASNTQFYVHLRQPVTFTKKSLLQKEGLSKFLDFLDVIEDDIPKGSELQGIPRRPSPLYMRIAPTLSVTRTELGMESHIMEMTRESSDTRVPPSDYPSAVVAIDVVDLVLED